MRSGAFEENLHALLNKNQIRRAREDKEALLSAWLLAIARSSRCQKWQTELISTRFEVGLTARSHAAATRIQFAVILWRRRRHRAKHKKALIIVYFRVRRLSSLFLSLSLSLSLSLGETAASRPRVRQETLAPLSLSRIIIIIIIRGKKESLSLLCVSRDVK